MKGSVASRGRKKSSTKSTAKIAKGGPVRHANIMQLGAAGPRVGAIEVVAQQPQGERERVRSRRSSCEGAAGVTLSDDPQLLVVNLVRSDGSPALTGHYLVDMIPQSDLHSVEEHFGILYCRRRHLLRSWTAGYLVSLGRSAY